VLFYDFEVFKYDWLVVIMDTDEKKEHVFVNNSQALIDFYNKHKKDIWVGYNSRHYDQYILKAIICGFYPQDINKWIIVKKEPGWKFYKDFWRIQLLNFDVMTNKFRSLKQLEGFQGHDIKESSVDFTIDRELTDDEVEEVIKYCRHDVQETMHIFSVNISEFESQLELLKMFKLPMRNISKTKAQLSAVILEAKQPSVPREDEFNFTFPDTLRINKYAEVLDFYKENKDYNKVLEIDVAGVPHLFAWGGLHGARHNYYGTGHFVNIDVASYYPALMIEYGYLSRNVINPDKFREIRDTRLKYKAAKDKRQAPLKIVINGTYGAMKDKYNGLYDPLQANNVCIGGMTLLLDLIEKLEPHCQVIQSNTDGVLVKLSKEEDYELIDDICYEWEQRTRMELEFESFVKVIQKDVNNYILVDDEGKYKSKGAYVKKLNSLDNDLPIVNEAVVNYFIKGIDPEETIFSCKELIKFQKIVKISGKYDYARYGTRRMNEKVFRVFASIDKNDKELTKVKDRSASKISYTPERCFIINDDLNGMSVPSKLDYWWYWDLAVDRINAFLGNN
jgi:DNA polymerase elongation subunit (family B)